MRFAVIVGVLLIAIPLLLRANTAEPFPDAASYEGLRQAELDAYDSLYATAHHKTISDVLFGIIPAQILLVILAAITLLALTYYYDSESFILFFATSPIFITVFTQVSEVAVGVAFIALAATLISKKQYWAVLIIPLCFSLSFSLGILATITCISVALIRNMPFVALGASFFALVSAIFIVLVAPAAPGISIPAFPQFLGLFGTRNGITIFLLVLGLLGFLVQYSKEHKAEQLVSLIIIPCALFFEYGAIIIAAFLAVYASRAWSFLSRRKWSFEEIRTLTLVLISCGILFTTIVVERERIALNEERIAATQFITSAFPQGTGIAAPQDIAPVLAYYGYPSAQATLPADPSFMASALRDQGYSLIVTHDKNPPYAHFPRVFQSNTFVIHHVP